MPEERSVQCEEGVLVGCGNPLLDIQAVVTKDFLDKWNLKENNAILADDSHIPMFEELVEKFEVDYIPGGATQNALRVCQWILNKPNRAVFFGAVGNDKYGEILQQKSLDAGVNVQYQVNDSIKTGTCAALIYKEHRSLCAHLAAANTFTLDHLQKIENEALIEKAKFFYIAGFFLTVCPPAIMKVARHAAEHNKVFMMNLAAPFISQFFLEPLLEALPYVDILFGNESEALAFADSNKFETTDIKEIAKKIAALPRVANKAPRMVVITQGCDPTIIVHGDEIEEFPVTKLKEEQLVDTNGAGDAFAGGFLAQFIQGHPLAEAVKCGHYAASTIIQQQGCTLPPVCDYH